jgi:hypothetical protein
MMLQRISVGSVRRIALAIALIFTTSFGILASLPTSAAQSVPYKVNFQGRLTDNNGNILPDGSYNIKFRLFDALSAGTNKYEEDRVFAGTDNRVAIQNGLFNIQLGDITAITPALFSGVYPLYLEVELPTPASSTCATNGCAVFTEGAMTPRQPMASSPYAISADTLDGIDSSGFVQLAPAGQQSGSVNISGAIQTASTVQGTGATFTGASALTLGSTTNAGSIVFNDGTATSRAVTLNSPALTGSYSLSLPTSAPAIKQCLQAGASTASQLVFASCSTGVTLQNVYSNSTDPEITLATGSTTGLTIKDATSAVTGNLLEVTNNANTTTYFGVTNAGISVTGIANATTKFTAPAVDTASAGTLSVGTSTATAITLGKAGVVVSAPGGITTSNGAINTGSGSITTTGALSSGAATVTSLTAGSGLITTSGNITTTGAGTITSASTISGTTINGTNGVFAPTAASTIGLVVKGTTNATTADVLDIYNAAASPTLQAFFNAAGSLNVSQVVQPTATNSSDIGLAGTTFRTGYYGTSVRAPLFDALIAGNLNIGTTTATGVTIGGPAIGVTAAGGIGTTGGNITTSNGTINTGTGSITTTGALAAGTENIGSGKFVVDAIGATTLQNSTDSQLAFVVKNVAGTRLLTVDTESSIDPLEVQIGSSSTPDSIQINLGLDNYNQFTDAASTCGLSNDGSLYYNTVSNSIRACVASNWEDVITTAGLGIIAFGVVSDSGPSSGDVQSLQTANTATGPCQPFRSAQTTIGWTQCVAYSGGRKVSISGGSILLGALTNNTFFHLCLNGTDSQPALSAKGAETANLPAFSASNPVLCLADIKTSNTAITAIYDTRVFSNATKTFAYTSTAMAPGRLAVYATGKITNTAAANAPLAGVVGVTDGFSVGANGLPNAILVTNGPISVKATAGAIGNWLISGGTAGYATPTATAPAAGINAPAGYAYGGQLLTAVATTCTTQINCFGSALVNLAIR